MSKRRPPPRIAPTQIRAVFAAGRRRGLGIDELRAMTPNGSISRLTQREADRLLDDLNRGSEYQREQPPRQRRPKGVYAFATADQRDLIARLRNEIGWSLNQLDDWLAKRHYRNDPDRVMNDIKSSADAVAVIELLKGVRDRYRLGSAGVPPAFDGEAHGECGRPARQEVPF